MTVAAAIVALYPPAVRERWGRELHEQLAAVGPRAWPDSTAQALRLWIHPSDWPEPRTGQTRRVVTTALVAIIALAMLLLRACAPASAALMPRSAHPVDGAWLALLAAGAVLAAPRPSIGVKALRALVRTAARTLAPPASLLLALYALAHTAAVQRPGWLLDLGLVALYWSTLTFAGVRACVLSARLAPFGRAADRGRLSLALGCVAAGLLLAAVDIVASSGAPEGLVAAGCLAALTASCATAARDLSRPR